MDNAGDWLYIVFLAIAGISSLFGSKNKNKKKRPQEVVVQPDVKIVTRKEKVPGKQPPAGDRLVVPPVREERPQAEVEFDSAAELRKAVIYAEILHRKY